jgi:hypothetical protein
MQYKLGVVSYLPLLIAERNYHQTRITQIIAQTRRYTDTAALFQALGGGWWNRPNLSANLLAEQKTNKDKTEEQDLLAHERDFFNLPSWISNF